MLKMERGAAKAAGRTTRVVDLDELKKARERRASSARRPSAQAEENRYESRREQRTPPKEPPQYSPRLEEDGKPFWEREDPFVEQDRPFWKQDRPFRGMEEEEEPKQKRQPAEPRRALKQTEIQEDRRIQRGGRQQTGSVERLRNPQQNTAPVERVRAAQQHTGPIERPKSARSTKNQGHAGLKMLLVLLGLLAIAVIIGLKVFEIQDIEVKGAETMTKESVIALSGIGVGENIFKVSLNQAKANLESDPLVEVLGISRVFPDRIKIEIRQRKPHGAIAWLDGYAIIDERGFTLDVRDSLPVGQYPLVTGIDIKPAERGKPIEGVDAGKMEVMQKLLTALSGSGALPLVSEVSLADPVKLLLLTAEGLRIDLGKPADLDKKAQWVASAVPELRKLGHTAGVLYVTGVNSPVYSADGTTNGSQQQNGDDASVEEDASEDGTQEDGADIDGGNQGDGPDNAA